MNNAPTDVDEDKLMYSLQELISIMVDHCPDLGVLLTNEDFMAIMDRFKGDSKYKLCKSILESFSNISDTTSDPVIIHALFDLARYLHDCLDSLSPDDERRQIGILLSRFVHKIDFSRDLEQHLNVLVDFRAAFPNLDVVKDK